MKICAIILDYRGARKTETCLRSLMHERIDTVLVINNSDNAQGTLQLTEAIARLKGDGIDYALHVLDPGTNLGFACGVNFAIGAQEASHCDTFLLLNNDASVIPGSIGILAATLLEEGVDLVAPAVVDDAGNPQPMLWYQRFFGSLTKFAVPGAFPFFSGCCLLLRRSLLVSGKLFDEDFFMYGEDTLLGWRMARERRPMRQEENATVRHTGQIRSHTSFFYEYHMARAHILLACKTLRSPLEILLLLPTKCLGLSLRALRRSLRYRNGAPIAACLLAWIPLDIRKTD